MVTKSTPPEHVRKPRRLGATAALRTAAGGRSSGLSRPDPAFKGRDLRTTLKKAGGSLVMTVPALARDALNLSAGQELKIDLVDNTMVLQVARQARPKYTLDELLTDCNFDAPYSDEERAWLDATPVGRELL